MIGEILSLYLRVNNISVRKLGKDIGISSSTVSRICSGHDVDSKTLVKLITWLFQAQQSQEGEI